MTEFDHDDDWSTDIGSLVRVPGYLGTREIIRIEIRDGRLVAWHRPVGCDAPIDGPVALDRLRMAGPCPLIFAP